jgi:hypothetical protein
VRCQFGPRRDYSGRPALDFGLPPASNAPEVKSCSIQPLSDHISAEFLYVTALVGDGLKVLCEPRHLSDDSIL